ncbi:Gdnf Family Receptor Alpha-1, partial [Manis pentadactyla]
LGTLVSDGAHVPTLVHVPTGGLLSEQVMDTLFNNTDSSIANGNFPIDVTTTTTKNTMTTTTNTGFITTISITTTNVAMITSTTTTTIIIILVSIKLQDSLLGDGMRLCS